jgi:hypothetical protein
MGAAGRRLRVVSSGEEQKLTPALFNPLPKLTYGDYDYWLAALFYDNTIIRLLCWLAKPSAALTERAGDSLVPCFVGAGRLLTSLARERLYGVAGHTPIRHARLHRWRDTSPSRQNASCLL